MRWVVIDAFCLRQFSEKGAAVGKLSMDTRVFENTVNEYITKAGGLDRVLKPGYAPFCKHIFMENFCDDARVLDYPVTDQNRHLLRTAYEARNEQELPVLVRYFEGRDFPDLPKAKYLDLILYSREQIIEENKAMGIVPDDSLMDIPYGIISIKPQDLHDEELPMQPITMMRNALGKEEGGSGVKLDRAKYMASCEYWSSRAPVKF